MAIAEKKRSEYNSRIQKTKGINMRKVSIRKVSMRKVSIRKVSMRKYGKGMRKV